MQTEAANVIVEGIGLLHVAYVTGIRNDLEICARDRVAELLCD